jgi:hypothetical protein
MQRRFSLDDPFLCRLVQIGVHRQADDVAGQAFAGRQAAVGDREIPIGGLLVHRFRIVDRGRNALPLQDSGKAVAIAALRQADGVLRPDRGAAAGQTRHRHDIAELAAVTLRHAVACGDFVVEDFQFLDQDRRLHGVEPPGKAEADIVVFVRTLAVDANAAQRGGEFGVVGENRPAVAEAAERLGRKEAGRGGEAEGTEPATLVAGAEGLGGVVEHEQALGGRDRFDGVMVGALPEQVDRDHRARL